MLLMYGNNLTLAILISTAFALLVAMTFHEFMHNYIGWLMGDHTPEQQNRLTLNPFVHIYWPGWFMFLIVGFGILGMAPINPNLMNYPRVRWANRLTRDQRYGIAVLAGPLGNLILAVFFGLLFRLVLGINPEWLYSSGSDLVPGLGQLLNDMILWNALLFFFNLIPLAPIDGHHILRLFLPRHTHYAYDNFQRQYGMMILFGLILLSFIGVNVFGQLIFMPTQGLMLFLEGYGMGGATFTLIVTVAAAILIVVGWLVFLRPQDGGSRSRPSAYTIPVARNSSGLMAPFRNFFKNVRTLFEDRNRKKDDLDDDIWKM